MFENTNIYELFFVLKLNEEKRKKFIDAFSKTLKVYLVYFNINEFEKKFEYGFSVYSFFNYFFINESTNLEKFLEIYFKNFFNLVEYFDVYFSQKDHTYSITIISSSPLNYKYYLNLIKSLFLSFFSKRFEEFLLSAQNPFSFFTYYDILKRDYKSPSLNYNLKEKEKYMNFLEKLYTSLEKNEKKKEKFINSLIKNLDIEYVGIFSDCFKYYVSYNNNFLELAGESLSWWKRQFLNLAKKLKNEFNIEIYDVSFYYTDNSSSFILLVDANPTDLDILNSFIKKVLEIVLRKRLEKRVNFFIKMLKNE